MQPSFQQASADMNTHAHKSWLQEWSYPTMTFDGKPFMVCLLTFCNSLVRWKLFKQFYHESSALHARSTACCLAVSVLNRIVLQG